MKLSIVVPTYNRKNSLVKTIKSLLNQTCDRNLYEIIIVDDGSSDGTEEEVRRLFAGVKFLKQTNSGPACARNRGIKAAAGEIIAFTDDDCVPPPDWVKSLMNGFTKYPDVAGVGGYQRATDELLEHNIYAKYEYFISREEHHIRDEEVVGGLECPVGGTNNLAIKKTVLEEVGFFDEAFPCAAGEDADLKYRICKEGYKFLYIPLYVLHHQSYTFKSFTRQCITRGKGVRYYQKKHGGLKPRFFYIGKFISIPVKFINYLFSSGISFALIHTYADLCYTIGKIKVK